MLQLARSPMSPVYICLGVLILFSAHNPWCSAANDTLTVGQALAVGDKLVSSNGKFALGFFQPQTTSKSSTDSIISPNWYLGIWFNKIPVFTAVWVANRDKPIPTQNSKLMQLEISRDGNLVIISKSHALDSIVWSTAITNSTKASNNVTVVLSNLGNLVVHDAADPSLVWWQSFDYPTNVLLPGAKVGWNKITGFNRRFVTNKNLINPGNGSYCVQFDSVERGIVLEECRSSVVYWSSGRYLGRIYTKLPEVDPLYSGFINYTHVDDSEEEYYMYTLLDKSLTVYTTGVVTGQIKAFVWLEASQRWLEIYSQPLDPCIVHAACGPFTVCSGPKTISCDCMTGFSVKSPGDWDLDDRSGGCIRKTPLACSSVKNKTVSTDKFLAIPNVRLPYVPQTLEVTDEMECAQACADDCSCTAYSYGRGCSVWHGELLNTAVSAGDVLYLRLAAKDLPGLVGNKRTSKVRVIIAASVVSFGLVLILLVIILRNRQYGSPLNLNNTQDCGGIIAFRYSDLGRATKNFSEKLGGGGFGSVYKGVLSDLTTIAVKRLDSARQGEKQFRAEVSSIGQIQHINLVRLIGFCCEGDKRLLVYEQMLNGSLDAHLFKSIGNVLNWSTRYQIAIGVARGLSYLHDSCRECIIHCDIKPENILLDASFLPKIADFGLAKFVGRDFSRVLTTFRGTVGYLAPEWISGVAITPKVDVYSFGMVLLELMSGKRNSPEVYSTSGYHVAYFPVQAINRLRDGDVQSLVDPQLKGEFNLEEVERVCKVAFWCIQDNEFDRPAMGDVVRVLECLQEPNMPPMPRLLAAITKCPRAASK